MNVLQPQSIQATSGVDGAAGIISAAAEKRSSDGEAADFLQLIGLQKAFGSSRVVDGFSISVRRGEFVSILGPSGCGKTTTLRMVAGFIPLDGGAIRIGGQDVGLVPTHKRGAAMVFQNYALFPHMTVFDNVAFGLRMHKVPTAEIGPRVDESLRLVRLSGLADRFPKQLSGGQQQRVALARAVVLKPKVLLLDEPLSNLDAKLRKDLRAEFHEIHRLSGITTLFVTHDLEEAFSLSDRVAVMNAGRLEQFATPVEIFNRPQSEFVADFVGHSNRLSGVVERDGQGNSVLVCSGLKLHLGRRSFPVGQTAQALVPGHSAMVSARATPSDNNFEAKIERVSFVGPRLIIRLAVGDYVLNFELPATKALSGMVEGDVVHLGLNSEDLVFLPDRGSTF